uniref:Putative peritrophin n=1 Tax=Lutzomyia longipalpis TaxID=7200 RepID=A0A7G3ASV1_LUTLO
MKFQLVVIFAIIGFAMGTFVCPEEQEQRKDLVMFPHESDCGKFYICSHGRPHEFSCPWGLYFNPEKNLCDWKENVECNYETTTPGNTEATPEEDY